MKTKFFCLIILLSSLIYSQSDPYSIGGYVKYLFSTVEYPQINSRYYDHLLHSRVNTKWYPSNNLTGTLELRFRVFAGGSVDHYPNYSSLIKTYQPLMDLDAYLWNNKSTIGYLEADRFYFDYYAGNLQTTIGRQRISWGTSWVWNPLDIFNPKLVLDFDHEELPSVDALRLQYYTGPVGKVELALAPAREKENSSYAALFSQNAFNYDFNFISGLHKDRWILGAGWSGSILEAGFRGEITYSRHPNRITDFDNIYSLHNAESISSNKNNILNFVLSGDYTFPNSFYIHTEILFNSNGKTKDIGLYNQEAAQLGMLSASRWSVYQEFSYDISPLLRGSIFTILNPVDNSFAVVPSLSYSIITNLDLYLIGIFCNGKDSTEYGEYGNYFYSRLKWSF